MLLKLMLLSDAAIPVSCQESLPMPDLNVSLSVSDVNKVTHWWASQENFLCICTENTDPQKTTRKTGDNQDEFDDPSMK